MKNLPNLPLGPLMIDIDGLELSALDHERLAHPLVGGVILFARNYCDRQQLTKLCADIHALRTPSLLVAIDHEGGRVQRCREGFTAVPAMRKLGVMWDIDPGAACVAARSIGYLLAAELRDCGVDFSFTPVLDLDWGRSGVIGDRAFHRDPVAVTQLAGALIEGLRTAGMGCCGKHFPGHGWVTADSHVAIPVDELASDMRRLVSPAPPFASALMKLAPPAPPPGLGKRGRWRLLIFADQAWPPSR